MSFPANTPKHSRYQARKMLGIVDADADEFLVDLPTFVPIKSAPKLADECDEQDYLARSLDRFGDRRVK